MMHCLERIFEKALYQILQQTLYINSHNVPCFEENDLSAFGETYFHD